MPVTHPITSELSLSAVTLQGALDLLVLVLATGKLVLAVLIYPAQMDLSPKCLITGNLCGWSKSHS